MNHLGRRGFLSTAGVALTAISDTAKAATRPSVIHIVLFKFLASAPSQAIDALMTRIRELPKEIPGILDVAHGRNFSPRSAAYTHAVTMRFRDRAALEAFYVHPAHVRLVNTSIKPIVAELLPVDYEDLAPPP